MFVGRGTLNLQGRDFSESDVVTPAQDRQFVIGFQRLTGARKKIV
jgi:hypothetical protein